MDSRVNIFVVQDQQQLEKVLRIRNQLPDLKAIIVIEGSPTSPEKNILTWDQLLRLGREKPDSILDERLRTLAVNQCCTLIYTSGTTGNYDQLIN